MSEILIPNSLHYSKEDEWVREEGERITIGVTDYAQQQLGDIVFVELPEVGRIIEAGEPFGVIESVKAVSDLFAPVSGEIVEVNQDLAEQPEVINEDCYGDGWMIVVSSSDTEPLKDLLDEHAYRAHCEARSEED